MRNKPRFFNVRAAICGIIVLAVFINLIESGDIRYLEPLIKWPRNIYGSLAAERASIKIVYSAPLRGGVLDARNIRSLKADQWRITLWQNSSPIKSSTRITLMPITPDASKYHALMTKIINNNIQVVIECSAIDAWHTTPQGLADLQELRKHALRVVIFDGGHHLPTLALQPDLIIIPETSGYAAHGYMKDAVAVEKLMGLAVDEKISCPIVTVSRWALVKSADSMTRITVRALEQLDVGQSAKGFAGNVVRPHLAFRGSTAYFYFDNKNNIEEKLIRDLKKLKINTIYMAVNYGAVDQEQVVSAINIFKHSGFRVFQVNEPYSVIGILARGGVKCITGRRL